MREMPAFTIVVGVANASSTALKNLFYLCGKNKIVIISLIKIKMDQAYYLQLFGQAAARLDKKALRQKKITVATGLYIESVVLKLYKLSWANQTPNPLTAPSRIFFSVWVSDQSIKENKLMYNIHALKLRQLNGYSITSRLFAADFRKAFKPFEKQWPNVSTDFGPLTLMQGWVKLNEASLQDDILTLSKQFLETAYLIDALLKKNRKQQII